MIDLHTHSIISDGMDTPSEIVKKAKRLGLNAIALTDHDCIAGLKEAELEAHRLGIEFIKGIEFSVTYGDNRLIHILGLGINPDNEIFSKLYTDYRKSRYNQIHHIFKGLNKRGIYPVLEEVLALSQDGYLDRQTIGRWLLQEGITKSMHSSWVDYLDLFPYREGELIDMKSALKMIKAAGGKSFMAHFHKPIGLKGYTDAECDLILKDLKSLGLDGLECYYPDFTHEDYVKVNNYVSKYDFIISGGSDYHGSNRPGVELGIGSGNMDVPNELLDHIL